MRNDNEIHLIIADDSEIFREGIKSVLHAEPRIVVDAEASSCASLRQLLESGLSTDLLLLDISMEKEKDGIEILSYLNAGYPDLRVIILSHYKEISYIVDAVRNRVAAYLAKDTPTDELLNIILSVHRGGGMYFGETISSDILMRGFGNDENIMKRKPYELGNREIEILKLIAEGMSAKEISSMLGINVTTVESYKERIKGKLGVNTIIEAVVFAVKCELF